MSSDRLSAEDIHGEIKKDRAGFFARVKGIAKLLFGAGAEKKRGTCTVKQAAILLHSTKRDVYRMLRRKQVWGSRPSGGGSWTVVLRDGMPVIES